MQHIAYVNQSTLVTDAQAKAIGEACVNQVNYHAAPLWSQTAISGGFYKASAVPTGADVIYFLDNADTAGALGYHTEDSDGTVYGRIFAKDIMTGGGGQTMDGPDSICSVTSHETLELWQDRNANRWVLGTDGNLYALELCDAVEADWYHLSNKYGGSTVSVSNFLTPGWFDDTPKGGTRYDYLKKAAAPFSLTVGGYVVYASFDQNSVQQKFGKTANATVKIVGNLAVVAHYGDAYPAWRKAMKASSGTSRTTRRLERSGLQAA